MYCDGKTLQTNIKLRSYRQAHRRGPLVDFVSSRLMEDAVWAPTRLDAGWRRAEKRNRAAWFDSQTRGSGRGRTCMEIRRLTEPNRGGNTQMRTRYQGKSGRELIFFLDDVGFSVGPLRTPKNDGLGPRTGVRELLDKDAVVSNTMEMMLLLLTTASSMLLKRYVSSTPTLPAEETAKKERLHPWRCTCTVPCNGTLEPLPFLGWLPSEAKRRLFAGLQRSEVVWERPPRIGRHTRATAPDDEDSLLSKLYKAT
ncbi:hypothetical protein Q8A73_003121 [Channa argus]|nr:hypothetical protein Q8A73_003121 [Channa argus]